MNVDGLTISSFAGGLDLVNDPRSMDPSRSPDCHNVELTDSGAIMSVLNYGRRAQLDNAQCDIYWSTGAAYTYDTGPWLDAVVFPDRGGSGEESIYLFDKRNPFRLQACDPSSDTYRDDAGTERAAPTISAVAMDAAITAVAGSPRAGYDLNDTDYQALGWTFVPDDETGYSSYFSEVIAVPEPVDSACLSEPLRLLNRTTSSHASVINCHGDTEDGGPNPGIVLGVWNDSVWMNVQQSSFVTYVPSSNMMLEWSEPASWTGTGAWPALNRVEIPQVTRAERIVGGAVVNNSLVVFTSHRTLVVEDASNGSNRVLSADVGCASRRSIVVAGGKCYFASTDGVYVTDGGFPPQRLPLLVPSGYWQQGDFSGAPTGTNADSSSYMESATMHMIGNRLCLTVPNLQGVRVMHHINPETGAFTRSSVPAAVVLPMSGSVYDDPFGNGWAGWLGENSTIDGVSVSHGNPSIWFVENGRSSGGSTRLHSWSNGGGNSGFDGDAQTCYWRTSELPPGAGTGQRRVRRLALDWSSGADMTVTQPPSLYTSPDNLMSAGGGNSYLRGAVPYGSATTHFGGEMIYRVSAARGRTFGVKIQHVNTGALYDQPANRMQAKSLYVEWAESPRRTQGVERTVS